MAKKKKTDSRLLVANLVKAIDQFCRRMGLSHDVALCYLLDALADWLTYDLSSKTPPRYEKYYNELRQLMCCFFLVMKEELEHRPWVDLFGDYFMEVAANVKGFGQCFTPYCLSELLSRLCFSGQDIKNTPMVLVPGFGCKMPIYDCAAGSSRLLLAAGTQYRQETGRNDCYLCAADIDEKCVKMSALNILFHGFYGEVVCQDTLMGDAGFRWGYIVNSGLYPFPLGLPSLQFSDNPDDFYQINSNNQLKSIKQ